MELPVIIDAVSPVQEVRDIWHNFEETHQATSVLIECMPERVLHKKRIETRIRNMYCILVVGWRLSRNMVYVDGNWQTLGIQMG